MHTVFELVFAPYIVVNVSSRLHGISVTSELVKNYTNFSSN